MSRIALVTGAARGLGLEICRQLLEDGDTVVAFPRKVHGEGLPRLAEEHGARLRIVETDIADPDSIEASVGEIARSVGRLDLVFNNAGVSPRSGSVASGLDVEAIERAIRVNAIGPLVLAGAVLALLRRGRSPKLVQLTSLMGSIADNRSGGSYAYRLSKCALNMGVANLAHELRGSGIVVLAIHPGWVKTDMGGSAAPRAVDEAVRDILEVVERCGPDRSGAFLGPGGKPLPW